MTQVARNVTDFEALTQQRIHHGRCLALGMAGSQVGGTRGGCRSEGSGSDEADQTDVWSEVLCELYKYTQVKRV